MKIYIISDRSNEEINLDNQTICKHLKQSGYKVDTSLINSSSKEDALDIEDTFNRNMNSIKKCDLLIAQSTNLSSGVGFMIATALSLKKPVLVLSKEIISHKSSKTLKGAKNRYLVYKSYNNENITRKLDEFLKEVRGIIDTKFILILPPEIERFLQWKSDTDNLHKAQIVRESVEDSIKKDREYQNYLKYMTQHGT